MGMSDFADFCNGDTVEDEHHCLQITFTGKSVKCLKKQNNLIWIHLF